MVKLILKDIVDWPREWLVTLVRKRSIHGETDGFVFENLQFGGKCLVLPKSGIDAKRLQQCSKKSADAKLYDERQG